MTLYFILHLFTYLLSGFRCFPQFNSKKIRFKLVKMHTWHGIQYTVHDARQSFVSIDYYVLLSLRHKTIFDIVFEEFEGGKFNGDL